MAQSKHRYPGGQRNFGGVRSSLVTSKISKENNALFQSNDQLTRITEQMDEDLSGKRNKNDLIDLRTEVRNPLPPKFGGAFFATYVPTLTPGLNAGVLTAFITQYLKANRLVYINGKISIFPLAGLTLTTIEVSLPFPSNFTGSDSLNGIAAAESLIGAAIVPGLITGNVALGTANIRFYSIDTNEHDLRFTFSYELL